LLDDNGMSLAVAECGSMLALLLSLAVPVEDAAALLARSQAMLVGERCVINPDATDITVCGRRNADRFRVPFVVHDEGDPRYEAVIVERDRLLNRTNPVKELSPFLVGGGMSGVTMSTKSGLTGTTHRSLAP
jgi:hypothetical protein